MQKQEKLIRSDYNIIIAVLLFILPVAVYIAAFLFSAQPFDTSREVSSSVRDFFSDFLYETQTVPAETTEAVKETTAAETETNPKTTDAESGAAGVREKSETTAEKENETKPAETTVTPSTKVKYRSRLTRYISSNIRKIAHVVIYFAFGITLFIAIYYLTKKPFFSLFISSFIGIAGGALDELHQYFVIGRSMLVSDILRDSLAAIAGAIIICVIVTIIKSVKEKRRKNDVLF